MIPLSRNGGDAAKLRMSVHELKSGGILSIFPQGTRCCHPLNQEDFKAGAGMLAVLSGVKILPVGIYSKNYKVRLFRRTYICFGEPEEFTAPAELGKKDQALYISERLYERIVQLEGEARKAAEK